MKGNFLLFVDALINLVLGVLLLIFSDGMVDLFGVPSTDQLFYPNILGAVLFGIGIALLIELFKNDKKISGLGLMGAIAINLCGGIVLISWLIFGSLELHLRGYIFLWTLSVVLITISLIEGIAAIKK